VFANTCKGVSMIERIEHTSAAKATIAEGWMAIVPALSADPEFLVWKNLDRALKGQGDIDAACPAASREALTHLALESAREHTDYGVAVICDHLPSNRLVAFGSEELFPSIAELHFCFQPFRRGTPWASPTSLLTQSIVDPTGIRRTRPAAEALVTLVTKGLSASGLDLLRDDERTSVRAELRSDFDGIKPAARALVPGSIQRHVGHLAEALADDKWNRMTALAAFWGFALLSLREPSKLLSRFNARRVVAPHAQCPTIATTAKGRIVDVQKSPSLEKFLADAKRGGDKVVLLR
jgi:hypothetical protein